MAYSYEHMFQSSSNRLRAWLKLVDHALDDVLGDPPADAQPHPHRRPLRLEHRRPHPRLAPGGIVYRPLCAVEFLRQVVEQL